MEPEGLFNKRTLKRRMTDNILRMIDEANDPFQGKRFKLHLVDLADFEQELYTILNDEEISFS